MSKDFEKEYIKLAESEIPDLWNRIEAGLTEKSTHTTESAPEQENKITHNIEWIRRYAGLAAAVLCIALIVPALMLFHPTAGKSSSADTSAPEAAEEEMAAGMTAEVTGEMAAAEAYDEMASKEAVEESAEVPAISGVSTDTDNQKRQFLEVKDEASVEAEVESEAESEAELKEELETAPEAESETGGNILRNVVVQVLSVQNDVYKEDGSTSGGVVYTVTVCEEHSGILEKGEELELYQTPELLGEMEAGQKYEIDILCDSEKEYPYIIDKIN